MDGLSDADDHGQTRIDVDHERHTRGRPAPGRTSGPVRVIGPRPATTMIPTWPPSRSVPITPDSTCGSSSPSTSGDLGHQIVDVGCHDDERCDYPDFGAAVGRAVVSGEADLGIAVCGSGIGIAMAANKIPGVRAATAHDVTSARTWSPATATPTSCASGERFVGETGGPRRRRRLPVGVVRGWSSRGSVAKIDALGAPSAGN